MSFIFSSIKYWPETPSVICSHCEGKGRVEIPKPDLPIPISMGKCFDSCPDCRGNGRIYEGN